MSSIRLYCSLSFFKESNRIQTSKKWDFWHVNHIEAWIKEVAPSDDLRKWFHEEPIGRWSEFRRRYMADLKRHRDEMRMLARRAMNENVTLLYSSSDEKHNNAVVIKQYLKMLEAR